MGAWEMTRADASPIMFVSARCTCPPPLVFIGKTLTISWRRPLEKLTTKAHFRRVAQAGWGDEFYIQRIFT